MSDGQIRDPYPIVHNKVLSPHFVNPTLRRARLIDWLNEHATNRAIVVAADAGYGKTTLLWQWEREVPFDCYWYKLDRNDRDWSLQISYLIEAVKERHPGFGDRTVSMLQQIGASSATGRATVTAYLISELNERLSEPATFIVDDWQFVASVTEVRGFWNQMLRDAPASCRFVFLARAKPQLQFARFAAHAGYAELRTDALRFTEDEIRLLFGEVYQDPLDPHELAEIERRTEGWAASLQLIEVSLRERKTRDERRAFIESITATRDSELFNFLAEEVLDQQPEQTRTFLLFTSILTQITPELAERMTGVHEGRKLLNDLEQRGIFTYRLDPETLRYRYHGLFRDFLERILKQERTDAEVVGLHIHAASYFETHSQWPDAIHHYLAAGLTSQAARLIARYGEDVVAGGGLGLVDGWLQQVPVGVVRGNARLSLLSGEALGMRGEWKQSIGALTRARRFFNKKADARMEALACVKLSNVLSASGEIAKAAKVANEGLAIVPPEALVIRLRLQGNDAVTAAWLAGDFRTVERTCREIAAETKALDLHHYAAIAHSNLGILMRWRGDLPASRAFLELAADFWEQLDRNPHADNGELVETLLALDEVDAARARAEVGLRLTHPWPRPYAQAVFGRAAVDVHVGDFTGAIQRLESVVERPGYLGIVADETFALLIEACHLAGSHESRIIDLGEVLSSLPRDERQEPLTIPAEAIVRHAADRCVDGCRRARQRLEWWGNEGASLPMAVGMVKLSLLELDHPTRGTVARVRDSVTCAAALGQLRPLRFWMRRLAGNEERLARLEGGIPCLLQILAEDPEFWRVRLVPLLENASGKDRADLLSSLGRYANKEVIEVLGNQAGTDVQDVRRSLILRNAVRVFVRTFGRLQVHRSSWAGPAVGIDRPRSRMLLGLISAHADSGLTRDEVLDTLWPDAGPTAATNSLNQTVFQLRRSLAPEYKDGEAPVYIVSSAELVGLQPGLVTTDVQDFRRVTRQASEADSIQQWQGHVERAIDLVKGEFLAELRYEDWVQSVQAGIHAEVRHALLPIARNRGRYRDDDLAIRAASALIRLDRFDEEAYIAIVERLASSGRRIAARELITRYAGRLKVDYDEDPSEELQVALRSLGVELSTVI